MEISYKREMKHNYLIIAQESEVCMNYESKMMVSNCIEGLLRFRIKYLDSRQYFYYEITSKQPLNRMLETRCITLQEIRQLIMNLSLTLNRLESYLLKEEQILLNQEYIYVEPESFQVFLCLIPGYQTDFPCDMTKLLQYILGKVNHQDKESVVLAYGLYQESLKDNYGVQDLMKLLKKDISPPKESKEQEIPDGREDIMSYAAPAVMPQEQDIIKNSNIHKRLSNNWKNLLLFIGFILTTAGSFGIMWLLHLNFSLVIYGIVLAMNAVTWSVIPKLKLSVHETVKAESDSWKMTFDDDADERPSDETEYLHVPETPVQQVSVQEETADTVLLFNMDDKKEFRRLSCMDREIGDITISYFPFIIGKKEGLVDYVLAKDTISRLHLRFDHDNDGYRVTDLNSTNGTTVKEYLLESNETVEISPGDEIYMANIGFWFI